MNEHDLRYAEVFIEVRLPGKLAWNSVTIKLGDELGEALNPLNNGHDCPLDPWSVIDGSRQRAVRQTAVNLIAEALSRELMRFLLSKDPKNGRYPEV